MSFFLWIAALRKILTLDNLTKRGMSLVNWCCMCQSNGELVDLLLLHCDVAYALWGFALQIFGIQWVMLSNVDTLLFSWKNWFGKHGSDLWNMVPACLMWLVWKERNRHTFEDMENSLDQLKTMFARTLFDWSQVRDFTHCSSILEFQVSLRFSL